MTGRYFPVTVLSLVGGNIVLTPPTRSRAFCRSHTLALTPAGHSRALHAAAMQSVMAARLQLCSRTVHTLAEQLVSVTAARAGPATFPHTPTGQIGTQSFVHSRDCGPHMAAQVEITNRLTLVVSCWLPVLGYLCQLRHPCSCSETENVYAVMAWPLV